LVWAALSFKAELLQGSTWAGSGSQVHPLIQTLFPNNDSVFKDNNTQLQPLSHNLNSMKVNFSIFPGQHNR
jgi:hypothetical protein